MILDFHPAAVVELEQAADWYQAYRSELMREFVDEVHSAFQKILEHPRAWQSLGSSIRQFRLHRFPYAVVYDVSGEQILVLAIAHLHRKPGCWRERLKSE